MDAAFQTTDEMAYVDNRLQELEEECRQLERMAVFARFNPNPIIEFSASGEVLFQNGAAQEMLHNLGKAKLEEILPLEARQIVADCVSSGKPRLRRELPVGVRHLSWSFFPIATLNTVHCYGGDITERIQLEKELRQSQKMDSIGKLAGGIAHDFNNMLTAISGYSGLLQRMDGLSEDGHKAAQQIGIAAERAADLTRQLLLISKRQFAQMQPHGLHEIITQLLLLLERLVGAQIHFEAKLDKEPLKVHGDRSMLEQVLLNLVVNARDAMVRGGKLTIETAAVELEIGVDSLTHSTEARSGSFVRLSVRDTGSGIEPDTLAHIFDPFFSTKRPGEGTGLGLSTVYAIIKQHDGWVEVETVLGQGTAFHVYLPRCTDVESPARVNDAPPTFSKGKGRVLVVEDEKSVRMLAVSILEECGYEILTAGSVQEALERWDQEQGKIDLLFADIVMPGVKSGKELADDLILRKPDLRVILTSGYGFDEVRDLPPGIQFLPKPYTIFSLASTVQEVLKSYA